MNEPELRDSCPARKRGHALWVGGLVVSMGIGIEIVHGSTVAWADPAGSAGVESSAKSAKSGSSTSGRNSGQATSAGANAKSTGSEAQGSANSVSHVDSAQAKAHGPQATTAEKTGATTDNSPPKRTLTSPSLGSTTSSTSANRVDKAVDDKGVQWSSTATTKPEKPSSPQSQTHAATTSDIQESPPSPSSDSHSGPIAAQQMKVTSPDIGSSTARIAVGHTNNNPEPPPTAASVKLDTSTQRSEKVRHENKPAALSSIRPGANSENQGAQSKDSEILNSATENSMAQKTGISPATAARMVTDRAEKEDVQTSAVPRSDTPRSSAPQEHSAARAEAYAPTSGADGTARSTTEKAPETPLSTKMAIALSSLGMGGAGPTAPSMPAQSPGMWAQAAVARRELVDTAADLVEANRSASSGSITFAQAPISSTVNPAAPEHPAPLQWLQKLPVLGPLVVTPIVDSINKTPILGSVMHPLIGDALPQPTPRPDLIPAFRTWSGAVGTYTFTPTSHIVLNNHDVAALGETADLLAHDLSSALGSQVSVVHNQPAKPGDIELTRGPVRNGATTKETGEEAYRLSVGRTVQIKGATDDAVFNGTQSLLQLLHNSPTLGYGTGIDWPTYPERGLMVDVGRKFFPVDWLHDRIRDMAYLKMNVLQLHLSDNQGFRLQSDTHPEITSPQHYTKQDIDDLLSYAAQYHVQVIPEIDFPAHAGAILSAHPELQLISQTGKVNPDLVDLSKPGTYTLMKDLINEYLPMFPGKYWHVGADEYLTDYTDYPQLLKFATQHYGPKATAKDVLYGYINWADSIVREANKTTRAWNDDLHPGDGTVPVNPDITVDYWSANGPLQNPWLLGSAYTPSQLVAQGHIIANRSFSPTYYTTGLRGQLLTTPTWMMYDLWDPSAFLDGQRVRGPKKNRGSMLSIWMDDPRASINTVTAANHDRLRVMAQETWGSPKPSPLYLGFKSLIDKIGEAPR